MKIKTNILFLVNRMPVLVCYSFFYFSSYMTVYHILNCFHKRPLQLVYRAEKEREIQRKKEIREKNTAKLSK